jgi:hypothetical protein
MSSANQQGRCPQLKKGADAPLLLSIFPRHSAVSEYFPPQNAKMSSADSANSRPDPHHVLV